MRSSAIPRPRGDAGNGACSILARSCHRRTDAVGRGQVRDVIADVDLEAPLPAGLREAVHVWRPYQSLASSRAH
eukprot:8165669-Pyramimonas_sp.AAC.1